MSINSKIEWTDGTWNPVTGCSKISPGCKNCYAQTFSERFRGVKDHPFEQGFDLKLWSNRITQPLEWKKPRVVFVNSMSDLFHEGVPTEFIRKVFETMVLAKKHIFQILTKRAERLYELRNDLPWAPNIWQGVSVENQDYVKRVDYLRGVPSCVRFISAEPLLGQLTLDLSDIHWVIVGGESGPRARYMDPEWVRDIRDQCLEADVRFFFKQWGGTRKKKTGRLLDGRYWDDMPHIPPTETYMYDKQYHLQTL